MSQLEPPDVHALTAAIGWIELGNSREALAELDRVSPLNQAHPGILDVRWMALAELKRWDEALAVGEKLVDVAPGNASGWLHRAYAMRRVKGGGLPRAWEALLPAAEKFPRQLLVAFNLACYACQMQRLDDARHWLRRAMTIGDETTVTAMALADGDLEPLWPELRK